MQSHQIALRPHHTRRFSRSGSGQADQADGDGDDANRRRKPAFEPALRHLSLVYVGPSSGGPDDHDLARAGYTSRLHLPVDKLLLFNALHAASAQPVPAASPRVTRLVDHYARDAKAAGGAEILLADDNTTNQKVISMMLAREGYRVTTVRTGRQALARLEEKNFALAIVDMNMPEMGGIEVAKVFRLARRDRGHMPFVVLTANATMEALEECEEAGMDAYLTKPIEADQLLRVVAGVLSDEPGPPRRARGNAPRASAPKPRHVPALHPAGPALDRRKLVLLEGLGAGRDYVRDLARNFLTEAQKVVDGMSLAWQSDDRALLETQAMALKDSACAIGASALRDLAGDLAATAGDEPSKRAGDVARIRSELARVRLELEAYLRPEPVSGSAVSSPADASRTSDPPSDAHPRIGTDYS